jgi:hypothetical protein
MIAARRSGFNRLFSAHRHVGVERRFEADDVPALFGAESDLREFLDGRAG